MSIRSIGIAALGVVCVPPLLMFCALHSAVTVAWEELQRRGWA